MKKWFIAISISAVVSLASASGKPANVLFMAGKASHKWNEHAYHEGCDLLAKALNNSGLNLKATVHYDSWPEEKDAFKNVDAIVFFCDGHSNHMALGHEAELEEMSQKGTGVVCLHYAVAAQTGNLSRALLTSIGGYYEENWSVNPVWTVSGAVLSSHPAARGVNPFNIKDEWYFHMRFRDNLEGITPVLSAHPPQNTISEEDSTNGGNPAVRREIAGGVLQHLAWASVNKSGSRGFGFTGGHSHFTWSNNDFRKLVLNAIVWTAGLEVPQNGVASETPVIPVNKSILQAIAQGDIKDMQRHIDTGVNMNEQNEAGWTPLHYAAVRGNTEAARLLIEKGADINITTKGQKTALHFAADRGFMELAGLLVDQGASVSAGDDEGWSPLHYAAAKSHTAMAEYLIGKGAPVNMTSARGGTPLHEAAASAKPEMIQLLLQNGADPVIKAQNGKTPLDYAVELGNKEAEKILSGAMSANTAH